MGAEKRDVIRIIIHQMATMNDKKIYTIKPAPPRRDIKEIADDLKTKLCFVALIQYLTV